jgi:hypothetical protein
MNNQRGTGSPSTLRQISWSLFAGKNGITVTYSRLLRAHRNTLEGAAEGQETWAMGATWPRQGRA